MNTSKQASKVIPIEQFLCLLALAYLLIVGPVAGPAQAQANLNQYVTNAEGTMDNSNDKTALEILELYNERFPWNKLNHQYDELVPLHAPMPKPRAANDTSVPEKRNSRQPYTGRSDPKDKDQHRLKKSADADTPTEVLAYDSCFVPCGSPTGWFLMDAEPWKFPKYYQYGIPCYQQPKIITQDKPQTKRDNAVFHSATGFQPPGVGQLTTYGLPISDTQFQLIDRENNQRFNELLWDPERFIWLSTSLANIEGNSMANSFAGSAESAWDNAALRVAYADGGGNGGALINIANEQSGVPCSSNQVYKTVPEAVWMVQQMYRYVYVPLAILFLLPGAVISQVKSAVASGFSLNAPEAQSPFEGMLRSVVAVFLIPATQVIVSYSIDVGNSMAYSVFDPWVNLNAIRDWTHNLTYNPPVDNIDNAIAYDNRNQQGTGGQNQGGGNVFSGIWNAVTGFFGSVINFVVGLINLALQLFGFGEGIGGNVPETETIHERQSTLSQILEGLFDAVLYFSSVALITLTSYQLVFMCYLFLLGPLAAAFYAWPDLQNDSSQQKLFRGVFSNWLKAVISLALWRFYWMVILAIMTQRLVYIEETRAVTNLQWEVAVFTCLLGLMLYVPFHPFTFDPADAFEQSTKLGQQAMGGGGGGGGAGGAGGGGGGGGIAGMATQALQQAGASPEQIQQFQSAVGANSGMAALAGNRGGAGNWDMSGTGANNGNTAGEYAARSGGPSNVERMNAFLAPPPGQGQPGQGQPGQPGQGQPGEPGQGPPVQTGGGGQTTTSTTSGDGQQPPGGVQLASVSPSGMPSSQANDPRISQAAAADPQAMRGHLEAARQDLPKHAEQLVAAGVFTPEQGQQYVAAGNKAIDGQLQALGLSGSDQGGQDDDDKKKKRQPDITPPPLMNA